MHYFDFFKDDQEQNEINLKSKARKYATKGNDLAFNGHYSKAIEYFTEAIKLDSSDYRFYGNRSYCYDKMNLYDEYVIYRVK